MDFKKLINFIKKITKIVSNNNSENDTEYIMSQISNYVFTKWVDGEKIDLDSSEIKNMMKKNKIKTLSKEEILNLINKYKNNN